jgi:hypothetical protein
MKLGDVKVGNGGTMYISYPTTENIRKNKNPEACF